MPSMSLPRWTCASKISASVGQLAPQLLVVTGDQLLGSFEHVVHRSRVYAGGTILAAVADVLIYADTVRSPEMRHEVPVAIRRPVPLRRERRATARCRKLVRGRPDRRGCARSRDHAAGGVRDRRAATRRGSRATRSSSRSCCAPAAGSGSSRRAVPATFPLELADHLRANGIEVSRRPRAVRRAPARRRTRPSSPGSAARSTRPRPAMPAARDLLRRAEPQQRRPRCRRRAADLRA